MEMMPSAVFLLSDGQFNKPESNSYFDGPGPEVPEIVMSSGDGSTPVNAIAFENPESAPAMAEIAGLTDGAYIRSSGGSVGLEEVYARISEMEKKELGSRKYTQYEHRFQWPLALAVLCLASEAFLSDRRRRGDAWRGRFQE